MQKTREYPHNLLTEAASRELRTFYRSLGDVTRLRIVRLLATEGRMTVGQLTQRLRVSQPLFSWHLRRLTRARIVRTERMGREVHCSFDRDAFDDLHERGFRILVNESETRG